MTQEAHDPRSIAAGGAWAEDGTWDEDGGVPAAGDDPFADLADVPLVEHVALFEAYHDELRARLAAGSGGASLS
jgi:hypothetical protein